MEHALYCKLLTTQFNTNTYEVIEALTAAFLCRPEPAEGAELAEVPKDCIYNTLSW